MLAGGCGQLLPVVQKLKTGSRPAKLFTIQLGWQKEQEDSDDILDTMTAISEVSLSDCVLTEPIF